MKETVTYNAILEEERLILDATEAIHGLMAEQGMNRVELARRVGISKGRVSQLLDGKSNMTLRSLSRLLGALGHRGAVVTEPLNSQAVARQPLHAHDLHGYVVSLGGLGGLRERSTIVEMKYCGSTHPRSIRPLTPESIEHEDLVGEVQEYLAGVA